MLVAAAPPASLRLLAPSFESLAAYEAILGEVYPLLDAKQRASIAEHSLRRADDGVAAFAQGLGRLLQIPRLQKRAIGSHQHGVPGL